MISRRALLVLGSFAIGLLLIAVLVKIGRVDLRATLAQLRSVSFLSLLKISLLNAVLVLVSTMRWRSIDSTLRHSTDSVQPRTVSYVLTSIGLAIGTVLPVQLAMSSARTMGTFMHGGAFKRGAAGTLYEQSFDVLTLLFLAFASTVTWLMKARPIAWAGFAALMTVFVLLIVRPFEGFVRWVLGICSGHFGKQKPAGRKLQDLSQFLDSGLFSAALSRRLVALSIARFALIVLTSGETAKAVGLHISLWQMAAAIPFVATASILAITPGGLGVNELTCAAALSLFGVPLSIGAQWAIANRVLVAASYFIVASSAAIISWTVKLRFSRNRQAVVEHH